LAINSFGCVKRQPNIALLIICRENLRNVLSSVYGNKESVDEELVEVILCCSLDLLLIFLSFTTVYLECIFDSGNEDH